MRKSKRSSPGRGLSAKEMAEIRKRLADMPALEEASQLSSVAGSATCLKLLYHLEQDQTQPVARLAERVGVSFSGISQHLAKLRMYGLVEARREAQSQYYRLTDHPFHGLLRALLFAPSGRKPHASRGSSAPRRGTVSRARSR